MTDKSAHTTDSTSKINSNQNYNDFTQLVNKSLGKTKENINRSIEESRNQIPRYNNIVNSYQEQSLQTAQGISKQYIESQKAVTHSLQSAWRPYSESFNGLVTSIASPDSMTKAYTKLVSNFADNAISAIRQTNNTIFSNPDCEINIATGKIYLKKHIQPQRKRSKDG